MAIDKAITDLPVAEIIGDEDLLVLEQNGVAKSVDGATVKSFVQNAGGGLSNEAKQALLALLEKVAYTDDQGQTYLDALETALYPPADLVK